MSYFVYYNDGYCDNGDHGLMEFDSAAGVEQFISSRMAERPGVGVDCYTVIQGIRREVAPKETIIRAELR